MESLVQFRHGSQEMLNLFSPLCKRERQIDKEPLLTIPIYNQSSKDQHPFIKIVDQIISAKQKDQDADTSALERQIGRLVYELYGLMEEEIGVIEFSETKNRNKKHLFSIC